MSWNCWNFNREKKEKNRVHLFCQILFLLFLVFIKKYKGKTICMKWAKMRRRSSSYGALNRRNKHWCPQLLYQFEKLFYLWQDCKNFFLLQSHYIVRTKKRGWTYNNDNSKIKEKMNTKKHFALKKNNNKRNKGPTTYTTEEKVFFFFHKNNVHTLWLTTLRLWLDLSKLLFNQCRMAVCYLQTCVVLIKRGKTATGQVELKFLSPLNQ